MNQVAKEIQEFRRSVAFMLAMGIYVYADMNHYYTIAALAAIEMVGAVMISLLESFMEARKGEATKVKET